MFVNLFAGGAPLGYQAVHKLVGRFRARIGIDFNTLLATAFDLKVLFPVVAKQASAF